MIDLVKTLKRELWFHVPITNAEYRTQYTLRFYDDTAFKQFLPTGGYRYFQEGEIIEVQFMPTPETCLAISKANSLYCNNKLVATLENTLIDTKCVFNILNQLERKDGSKIK